MIPSFTLEGILRPIFRSVIRGLLRGLYWTANGVVFIGVVIAYFNTIKFMVPLEYFGPGARTLISLPVFAFFLFQMECIHPRLERRLFPVPEE